MVMVDGGGVNGDGEVVVVVMVVLVVMVVVVGYWWWRSDSGSGGDSLCNRVSPKAPLVMKQLLPPIFLFHFLS